MTVPETIDIQGKTYRVENGRGGSYWLFGGRGAKYRTHRVREVDSSLMFLVSYSGRSGFRPDPLGPIRLTDKDGTLTVV